MIRRIALAIALVLASVVPTGATPSANQTVRCADLVAAVGAGTLTWLGSAQTCANGNLIINRATFVAWIANSGSCAGSGGYIPVYGDMISCKTGGGVTQQFTSGNFLGGSSSKPGAICINGPVVTVFSTGSAVAPTTSAHQIAWTGVGSNAAFTLTIALGGVTKSTQAVPGNTLLSFVYFSGAAAAGVYTFTESGLASVQCPTVGFGTNASGQISWYQ